MKSHNDKYNKGESSFKMALNKFSDMVSIYPSYKICLQWTDTSPSATMNILNIISYLPNGNCHPMHCSWDDSVCGFLYCYDAFIPCSLTTIFGYASGDIGPAMFRRHSQSSATRSWWGAGLANRMTRARKEDRCTRRSDSGVGAGGKDEGVKRRRRTRRQSIGASRDVSLGSKTR